MTDAPLDPREILTNHALFARTCLSIPNKQGIVVPLRLTYAQGRINDAITAMRREGKPARLIVLKARQVHCSVGVASRFFHETILTPWQKTLVVSHTATSVGDIFGYYQHFYEHYRPPALGITLPSLRRETENMLQFDLNWWIRVATAENVRGGRSASLRRLHLSEFAFWRDAKSLMKGLMGSIPDDIDTAAIIESTANGVGGRFHEIWQDAQRPRSDWMPLFFAWHDHYEYERAFATATERMQFLDSMDLDERDLFESRHIAAEKLNWRRKELRARFHGDLASFRQEYPGTPEEAFQSTGRIYFDMGAVNLWNVIEEPSTGTLEVHSVGPREMIHYIPRPGGTLTLFKQPADGHFYVIGADSAEGKATDDSNTDPDYCVAHVYDTADGDMVAHLRERFTPARFGAMLDVLARFFNFAFIVPEYNNTGIAVIEELLRQEYPAYLIYQQESDPGKFGEARTVTELGWRTTTTTRPLLISRADTAVRERALHPHHPNTQHEFRCFVIKSNGKVEATTGEHDDEVIAYGLAVCGLSQAHLARRYMDERQRARRAPEEVSEPVRYRMNGRLQ